MTKSEILKKYQDLLDIIQIAIEAPDEFKETYSDMEALEYYFLEKDFTETSQIEND